MSRILALDYGEKRIGVAMSDELGIIASGLSFIPNQGEEFVNSEIKELCKKHSVAKIVVGLPKGLSGADTAQTKLTQEFINKLQRQSTIIVESIDERLSSVMAKNYTTDQDKKHKDEDIDSAAARVFLQDYLDSSN